MQVKFFKKSLINNAYEEPLKDAVKELIRGESLLVNGKFTSEFENNFANFIGVKYCSFVSNGIDALSIALQTLNLKEGDEIIIPNHTYIASWLAALNLGLKVIAAPVKSNNLLIDEKKIKSLITNKTKCIMPVHLYGNSSNMPKINEIANKYGLYVIDDAAQAHGSIIKNRKIGSYGNLTCFSFYPTKNLGALGEAGCITTNNKNEYEKINAIRNYGKSNNNKSINIFQGSNYRGDELQAAFLIQKLKNINSIIKNRMNSLKIYEKELKLVQKNKLRLIDYDVKSSPHLAVIKLTDKKTRDELKTFLKKRGIETLIHYPIPCHKQPFLNGIQFSISKEVANQAENISSTILSLPLSEVHTKDELNYVANSINNFIDIKLHK